MIYAVIDTNILVSSFITKNELAGTRKVVNSMLDGLITPIYNEEILSEYSEVLLRPEFHIDAADIGILIHYFRCYGLESSRTHFNGEMLDEDDRVFYEITLSNKNAFLVTGNLKHFPKSPQVVTVAQIVDMLESQ